MLDESVLTSGDLESTVVEWAGARFEEIVESGYLQSHLAVEDATADVNEDSGLGTGGVKTTHSRMGQRR